MQEPNVKKHWQQAYVQSCNQPFLTKQLPSLFFRPWKKNFVGSMK